MQLEELFEETELACEQARLIIEGSAYYDIEDENGKWLRILCEFGDLIILPPGRPFRFTTTPKVYHFFSWKKFNKIFEISFLKKVFKRILQNIYFLYLQWFFDFFRYQISSFYWIHKAKNKNNDWRRNQKN